MRVLTAVLAVLLVGPLQAQDLEPWRGGLPDATAARIEALLADPGTLRLRGTNAIAANRVVEGSVVAEGGVLSVAGTVAGQLVVLGGDLVLEPGARIQGDVLVVDGEVSGEEDAQLGGSLTVYGAEGPWRPARRIHGAEDRWEHQRGEGRRHGDADFTVQVAGNYNRVEGLPVAFGPDIRTGGSTPLRLQALAIWRTEAGPLTNSARMGYVARVEQFLPGQAFRVGAALRSTVHPIEAWSVTDVEASLATALLHRDQRDYFEREGWSAYLRYAPRRSPVDAVVEYRDERHGALGIRDPWTLTSGGDTWRRQPLVAEGDRRSLYGRLEVDGTRGWEFGRQGWYAAAEVEHGLDGTLEVPAEALTDGPDPLPAARFAAGATTGLVDLRSFQPAGLGGVLAVRVVAGGALDRRPLPPQDQHALGGSGSLPGYGLFAADCGARGALVGRTGTSEVFHPAYGCDRFALFQAEYRGGFDVRVGDGEDNRRRDDRDDRTGRRKDWRHGYLDLDVDWTVFFDAGRGATHAADGTIRSDTGGLYDVGAGIVLGDVGIYGAAPLSGENRDVRFFVRVGPRF